MFGLGMFKPVLPKGGVDAMREQQTVLARRYREGTWEAAVDAHERAIWTGQAMPSPLDRRPQVRGAVSEVKFDEMLAAGAIE